MFITRVHEIHPNGTIMTAIKSIFSWNYSFKSSFAKIVSYYASYMRFTSDMNSRMVLNMEFEVVGL